MLIPWPFFIFFTVLGACVGSFLNVVVWRLPRGKSIVSPPSACPKCGHKLAIYDNVPVLGWVWLRGRCRYCKAPISAQYPIMEALCAAMFGGLFAAYYLFGAHAAMDAIGPAQSWMLLLVHLFLLGALIASSKIDASLYIIPLEVPWAATLIAVIAMPLVAAAQPLAADPATLWPWPTYANGEPVPPPIWTGPAWTTGAAIGGAVGLVIALVLLRRGVLPYSFAEEEIAETAKTAAPPVERKPKPKKPAPPPSGRKKGKGKKDKRKAAKRKGGQQLAARDNGDAKGKPSAAEDARMKRKLYIYFWVIVAIIIGVSFAGTPGLIAAMALLWWGLLIVDFGAYDDEGEPEEFDPANWPMPERPRIEALKELLFLSLPIAGGVIGAMIAQSPGAAASLPWRVLAGVVFGYLIGGGFVWLVRIFGTLGFNKEAMGLGDVHLVAAIGAVLGPADAVIAFLLAAFFGLAHTLLVAIFGKVLFRRGLHIPYGPHLAGAAVIFLAFRTPIVQLLRDLNFPIR